MSCSIRQEIKQIVYSITPFDHEEEQHICFVLEWLSSSAEIFRLAKPATPKIHLVSYFLPIDQMANQLLLVDHKKAGLWLPAGGHVEYNEHPKETVMREIQEELGITAHFLSDPPLFVTVTETVGNMEKHTDVSLWYALKGSASESLVYDGEEFYSTQWFLPSAIPYFRADPHLERCIKKLTSLKLLK